MEIPKNHRFTLPPGDWVVPADAETVHAKCKTAYRINNCNFTTSGVIFKTDSVNNWNLDMIDSGILSSAVVLFW